MRTADAWTDLERTDEQERVAQARRRFVVRTVIGALAMVAAAILAVRGTTN